MADEDAAWIPWDDRIYRVELGDSTTTGRRTRRYRVDRVVDDESALRDAIAAEFLIQFEQLPKGEQAIVAQVIDGATRSGRRRPTR